MPITAHVPVPIDWEDAPIGELLQASYSGRPVLCIKLGDALKQVAVLRAADWKTFPSVAPIDIFDPFPLLLPGTFLVEPVPNEAGDIDARHERANGNLRVMSNGSVSIVTGSSTLVPLGQPRSDATASLNPIDFRRWRIIEIEPGQPRLAARVVYEHGAPQAKGPPLGGVETWATV